MDAAGLYGYHLQEPRGTHCGGPAKCEFCERELAHEEQRCGGYYRCSICAERASLEKSRTIGRFARVPTVTADAARSQLERRRSKAKAQRQARKTQRRRAR